MAWAVFVYAGYPRSLELTSALLIIACIVHEEFNIFRKDGCDVLRCIILKPPRCGIRRWHINPHINIGVCETCLLASEKDLLHIDHIKLPIEFLVN